MHFCMGRRVRRKGHTAWYKRNRGIQGNFPYSLPRRYKGYSAYHKMHYNRCKAYICLYSRNRGIVYTAHYKRSPDKDYSLRYSSRRILHKAYTQRGDKWGKLL